MVKVISEVCKSSMIQILPCVDLYYIHVSRCLLWRHNRTTSPDNNSNAVGHAACSGAGPQHMPPSETYSRLKAIHAARVLMQPSLYNHKIKCHPSGK